MENLEKVFFFAVAVKSIVEYVATWFVDGKIEWKQITTCVVGIMIALFFNLDAFEGLGIASRFPVVSIVLTGIVISGGSNMVYDLFSGKKAKKLIINDGEEVADIYEKG